MKNIPTLDQARTREDEMVITAEGLIEPARREPAQGIQNIIKTAVYQIKTPDDFGMYSC